MTRGWIAAGVFMVIALLAATHVVRTSPTRARQAAAPSNAGGAAVILGGAPRRHSSDQQHPRGQRSDEQHPLPRPAPEDARRTAAAFLRSYLAYELGRATFRDLRALRSTATVGLWSQLNSGRGEPQPPSSVPAARLSRLVPGVSARRRAVAVLATLRRGLASSALALVLRREGGTWRVAGIGR